MPRAFVCLFLVLVLAGGVLAGPAVVVSYDKDTLKLVVKEGEKERTIELKKAIHVHDVDGKEVKLNDRANKLKKGTRIDIEEEKGKVVEINIKK
jgi:hypothetical protein